MIVNANSSLVLGEFANTLAASLNVEGDDVACHNTDIILGYLYRLCGQYNVNLDGLRRASMLLAGSYTPELEQEQPQVEEKSE